MIYLNLKKFFSNRYAIWGIFVAIYSFIFMMSPFVVDYSADGCKAENPEIKVSVIVPVYNTEKYLPSALDSLINQTLKDIEIICVNDGSKDNSLAVLNEYKEKDNRIKVISQPNSGVCVARNTGIENSKGEYIAFFDSDDLMVPYAYEKAYDDAIKYNVDIVNMQMTNFIDGEEIDINSFIYDNSKVKRIGRMKHQNPFYIFPDSGYVTTKLYKRSLINDNNFRFKAGVTNYEDGLFNFFVLTKTATLVHDSNVFYCYRTNRPGSAVTNFNINKIMKSGLAVANELVTNSEKFDFRKSNEWIVAKCLDINYNHIVKDAENTPEIQKEYAKEFLKIVNDNYVKKYNYKYPNWIYEQIEDIKKIAY